MSRTALLWIVFGLLVAEVVLNLLQLWWFARRANPVPGPPRGRGWDQVRADDLAPGDVARSSHLGPRPEWVAAVRLVDADRVGVRLRRGAERIVGRDLPVRRWQPDEAPDDLSR